MSAGGAKYERSSGCAWSSRRCSRHSISRPTTGSHASCESSTSSCASRSLQCPCSSCALYAVCRVFSRSAAAALAGHCYGLRSYAWLGRPRTRRAVWWPRRTRACGRDRQGWRPPARAALCSFPPKAYSAERENNARASKGICGTTVSVSLCVVVVVFSHTDEYLSELDSLWS